MILCEHCLRDSVLINAVRSIPEVKKKECPVCHSISSHFYDTDKDEGLIPHFENLLDIYTVASNLQSGYPKEKIHSLVCDLDERWELFSSNIKDKDKIEILKSICPGKSALFTGEVGIPELYDSEYLQENALVKNGNWEDFVKEIQTINRYHSKLFESNILQKYCSFIRQPYKKGDVFYRARISDKEGFKPEDMSAPPAGKSSEGRANARGIKCLYLADDPETTLREIRASLFDFVTVGKFILKQDITVVNFRIIMQISPFFEEMDLKNYAVNVHFLERIHTEMEKSLRKSDSTLDYVPTQYIVDSIKTFDENGSLEYSGIEYNSTVYPKGYNLAVFDPTLFECVSSEVYEITDIDYKYKKVGK